MRPRGEVPSAADLACMLDQRLGDAVLVLFFFSSRRRHTRSLCDWSSDVCSSDLKQLQYGGAVTIEREISGPRQIEDVRAAKRSEERRVGKECRSRWSPNQ